MKAPAGVLDPEGAHGSAPGARTEATGAVEPMTRAPAGVLDPEGAHGSAPGARTEATGAVEPKARALLLVDHGSRVAAANAQLAEVARLVETEARRGGDGELLVRHAHMELGAPSIGEAIDALAAMGAVDVVLVPYFLAPGRHATRDVPRLAEEAASRHPELSLRMGECLGVHELMAKLVLVRAKGG